MKIITHQTLNIFTKRIILFAIVDNNLDISLKVITDDPYANLCGWVFLLSSTNDRATDWMGVLVFPRPKRTLLVEARNPSVDSVSLFTFDQLSMDIEFRNRITGIYNY